MIVIIPCGGKGTRRLPESKDCPKVLLPYNGEPILDQIIESVHVIDSYPHFIFVLNRILGYQVVDHMSGHVGLRVSFCYQDEPLGFGHAVLQARDLTDGEPVMIHASDTILDFTDIDCSESWMSVRDISPPSVRGVLDVKDGFVTTIIEKPRLSWNAVCYIRESDILFKSLQMLYDFKLLTGGEYQMTDALTGLIESGVKVKAILSHPIYTES